MHTEQSILSSRRAHWCNHYRREVQRIVDELRTAEGRLRAWRLQVPDAPENDAHQAHIEGLRMMLNKYRANLERWSKPA
jgi:hypothetical protein